MIDRLRSQASRKRIMTVFWGVNTALALALIAFALRDYLGV